jgi:hypothetical protein
MDPLHQPQQKLEQLRRHYVDPSQPGAFSGLDSFFRGLKRVGINRKRSDLHRWLQTQNTYTLHKPVRKKFKRNKVIVAGIDHLWQIDLVDLKKFAYQNNRNRYIITCIDAFSKYAWAIPVKKKDMASVRIGFLEILNQSGRRPINLQADEGTEFFNQEFRQLLRERNINLYAVKTEKKACIVERFNRTLKEKMFRYFTYNNTKRYVDVLDDILNNYNNSYHRTIQMSPADVTEADVPRLWRLMFYQDSIEKAKFHYSVGDYVLMKKKKNVFSKGYTQGWEKELYIVTHRFPKNPPKYKIRPLQGRPIVRAFYSQEIQRIFRNQVDLFSQIEKILRIRLRNGRLYSLVRWSGLSADFDTWVAAEALANYNFIQRQVQEDDEEEEEEEEEQQLEEPEIEIEQDEPIPRRRQVNPPIVDRPRRPNAGRRINRRFIEEQEEENQIPRRRR